LQQDTTRETAVASSVSKGTPGFIRFWNERRPVTILEAHDDTFVVSAGGGALPAKRVGVMLEVPTLDGMVCYNTHVAAETREGDETLLLRRCASVTRFDRRRTWRVPLHTRTRVFRPGEPRGFGALTGDVSAGGVRMLTEGHFHPGDGIVFRLHLPGKPAHQVAATVVRTGTTKRASLPAYAIGAIFEEMAPAARNDLTRYIWKRLLQLHPREVHRLFHADRDRFLEERLGVSGDDAAALSKELS
jgi:hypothetical protein